MHTNSQPLVMDPNKLQAFAMRLEAELRLDSTTRVWFIEESLGSYSLHWLDAVQALGPNLVSTSCGAGVKAANVISLEEFVSTGKNFPDYCPNCLLLAALNERVREQPKQLAA